MRAPQRFTVEVSHDRSDDHPGWFARVLELPGCMTQADTIAELGPMLEDAIDGWVTLAIEDGYGRGGSVLVNVNTIETRKGD